MDNIKDILEFDLKEANYYLKIQGVYFESKVISAEIVKDCFDEDNYIIIKFENGYVLIDEGIKLKKIDKPSRLKGEFEWCFTMRNDYGRHIGYIGKPIK